MKLANKDEEALRLMAYNKAEQMWQEMTANERTAIRFGMFPAAKMLAAEKEGHHPRWLAVALMDQAGKDGGMVA